MSNDSTVIDVRLVDAIGGIEGLLHKGSGRGADLGGTGPGATLEGRFTTGNQFFHAYGCGRNSSD